MEKNPAINLPYLIDGENVVSESDAIIIYAIHKCNKLDLLGRNGEEQTSIFTFNGVIKDLLAKYLAFIYGPEGK